MVQFETGGGERTKTYEYKRRREKRRKGDPKKSLRKWRDAYVNGSGNRNGNGSGRGAQSVKCVFGHLSSHLPPPTLLTISGVYWVLGIG